MKVDVNQLGWLIIIIWIIQLIFYLVQITFPNTLNFGIRKIFFLSVATCMFLSLTIMLGGFYKNIPGATCGTENFNPVVIIGIYGSIGSLIIYIFVSILNIIANRIRKETRR